jgi:hypothetical protein
MPIIHLRNEIDSKNKQYDFVSRAAGEWRISPERIIAIIRK